jgi:menaquinone-dependent protoporphyrinogen oxidase
MRILVATASRHGATTEIARAIATELASSGLEVEVREPDDELSVERFDGVILGSAVYMGRWLEPARRFAMRNGRRLGTRPTWLFSSGPIGDPPKPDGEPADIGPLIDATAARGHRIFAGRLDRRLLGLGERAIVGAMHVPDRDDRDWTEIRDWARDVAVRIRAAAPAVAVPY